MSAPPPLIIEASALRDAALIINGNAVEHYEIALYGSLVALAKEMRLGQPQGTAVSPVTGGVPVSQTFASEAVRLLESTLAEEKAADAKLTEIAEKTVNPRAAQMGRAARV